MELYWIRHQKLLLEVNEGDAWIRTKPYEYGDEVPAIGCRRPIFVIQVFSDPDEHGERKMLSVTLSQEQMAEMVAAANKAIKEYTELKDKVEKELSEITQAK